jgi:predicted  nucleic acid-binding Zn-ribbon protein
MACMEHECTKCGWTASDNNGLQPNVCPKCGAKVNHFSDEDFRPRTDERFDSEDDYDEEYEADEADEEDE